MTLRHVSERLSLYIEGDLEVREAEGVEAHLAHCEPCRAEAEALRASQAWMKESATLAFDEPFSSDERDQLRAAVLARVRARRRPAALWIAALAAAGLAFFFIRPQPASAPAVSALPLTPLPTQPVRPPLPAAPPLRVARRLPAPPPPDASEAGPGPARIEIQTYNPKIRIIWLAQAKTDEGAPHLNPEEP